MRYTLSQPGDPRTTLVVDTVASVEPQAIEALKTFMFESGCTSGLLFDETVCVLLRDRLEDLSVSSVHEEVRIPTAALLGTLGARNQGSLDLRVGRWLELLSSTWRAAVPVDSVPAQELIYDVVSAATGALVHPWSAAA